MRTSCPWGIPQYPFLPGFSKAQKGIPGFHAIIHIGVNDCCAISFTVVTFSGQRRLNNQLIIGGNGGEVKGPEIELGKWNHVAAVYNGAKKNLLYLNGVEVATGELEKEPDIQPGPDTWQTR